jgi:hypothetical protein
MEFVSFEIATKLKEKGFDRPCIYAYCEVGGWNKYKQVHEPITHILKTDANPFCTFYTGKNWNREYETNKNKIRCSAPTISQVLKWLREEKKIYLELVIAVDGEYMCDIYKIDVRPIKCLDSTECLKTYEDAALAGIEYTLNNLI